MILQLLVIRYKPVLGDDPNRIKSMTKSSKGDHVIVFCGWNIFGLNEDLDIGRPIGRPYISVI